MGLFSVDKAAKNMAKTYEKYIEIEQDRQKDYEFGQNLLSNIRQQRIANASIQAVSTSDDVIATNSINSIANINSSLAGEVGRAYTLSENAERLQYFQETANNYWEDYAESVEKASTAGKVVGTIATVAGSIVGGPVGAAVGAAIGTGVTQLMGGGHVATSAAVEAGVRGTVNSFATAGLTEYLNTTSQTPISSSAFLGGSQEAAINLSTASRLSGLSSGTSYAIDPSTIGYGSLVDNSSSMFRGVMPFRSVNSYGY